MIISCQDDIYKIEMLIETKSSLKATFEDIDKFIRFQKFTLELRDLKTFPSKIFYKNYVFTIDSFNKIMNNSLSDWSIYICVNNYTKSTQDNIIEKSHLYFSSVIKIVDDKFIKDFYIENNDESIFEKYQIIEKNRFLIESRFKKWCDIVHLNDDLCNIFYINHK
jgi:hypothetical protein